jgi:hypothetical protein
MDAKENWGASVSVIGSNTVMVRINSANEALHFMRTEWPGTSSPRVLKALRVIGNAIAGRGDVTEARNAFLAACSEADCVIRIED